MQCNFAVVNIVFGFGDFDVIELNFPKDIVEKSGNFRVLFKHLVSLGHIQSQQISPSLHHFSPESYFAILHSSAHQWFEQNPFGASKAEYDIIFDIKESIDTYFKAQLPIQELVQHVSFLKYKDINRLIKAKVGMSTTKLAQQKLLVESQKAIAFTDDHLQQIAYQFGFKDPAYFSRFFRAKTQISPSKFRETHRYTKRDSLLTNLLELIERYHPTAHQTAFYAQRLFMDGKTLSKKIKEKTGKTVGELIRSRLIAAAKKLLTEGESIKHTAFALGFSEASHFSAFFKQYTQQAPSAFQNKMYQL